MQAPSDGEYLSELLSAVKAASEKGQGQQLLQSLSQYSANRELEIERICNANHQEFVASVNQLLSVRDNTVSVSLEIFQLNQGILASIENLVQQKKELVISRGVRRKINEATQALRDCLEVLRLANHVHDLLSKKSHYSALRALDELQNVHLREITQYEIADMIQRSVPATKKLIADAVMIDLNTWLFRIRETSQFLGEVAFYHTEQRRTRQKDRSDGFPHLHNCKLNSPIELVSDETDEFDILFNEDVHVDFRPLLECLHIHNALGQTEKFRNDYAATRRQQKDLLMPSSISLVDVEGVSLNELLEGMAGFAIVEKATLKKTPDLRSAVDVDELWDSMCQSATTLISKALQEISNAEVLLKIKSHIALFIQTMDVSKMQSESSQYCYSTNTAAVMDLSSGRPRCFLTAIVRELRRASEKAL